MSRAEVLARVCVSWDGPKVAEIEARKVLYEDFEGVRGACTAGHCRNSPVVRRDRGPRSWAGGCDVVAAKTGLVRLERLGIILRRCDKRAKLDGADALFTSKRYEDTLMPQENAMQSHLHAKAFNARSLHARNTQHLNRYADLERLRR